MIDTQVGEQIIPDGALGSRVRQGNQGELITQAMNGDYYELMRRGYINVYSTVAAGVALLVPAVTGNHVTIWNPWGSNKLWVPFRLELSISGTPQAPGLLGLALTKNAGAQIGATTPPIITFADLPAQINNALIGAPADLDIRFACACTFVAAPAWFSNLGVTMYTATAAAVIGPTTITKDFKGLFALKPGNALSIVAQQGTTTALVSCTWYAAVIPIPPGRV